jgi:hypothetical protein
MLVAFGASAATVSVVDYAQCANQSPTGPDSSGSSEDCKPQGWINGILQASNSHYREDEVTPQRLEVKVAEKADHTITLRYMTRKGTTHAYDYLASYDDTAADADRCQGLSTAAKVGIGCDGNSVTPSSFLIPKDDTAVNPVISGYSNVTSDHQRDGYMKMYGGTITNIEYPVDHTAASASSGDDYATIKVTYSTTGAAHNVQLLFGGHLASPTDWGAGLGASFISGGPYHIKWDAADGASVGNRDNQIMGSAILVYFSPSLTSSASPSPGIHVGVAATVSDTAYYTPATGASVTGDVSFALWGPFVTTSGVTTPTPTAGACTTTNFSGGAVKSVTGKAWAADADQTNFPGRYVATTGDVSIAASDLALGDYYWVVTYAGDGGQTLGASAGCADSAEKLSVTKANPTAASSVILSDTFSVTAATDGGPVGTGNVRFRLYRSSSTVCADTLVYDSDDAGLGGSTTSKALNSSGSATSDTYTASTAGTYNWVVDYAGDSNNNGVSKGCGTNGYETAVVSYPAT